LYKTDFFILNKETAGFYDDTARSRNYSISSVAEKCICVYKKNFLNKFTRDGNHRLCSYSVYNRFGKDYYR